MRKPQLSGLGSYLFKKCKTWEKVRAVGLIWRLIRGSSELTIFRKSMSIIFFCLIVNVCKVVLCIASWKWERSITQKRKSFIFKKCPSEPASLFYTSRFMCGTRLRRRHLPRRFPGSGVFPASVRITMLMETRTSNVGVNGKFSIRAKNSINISFEKDTCYHDDNGLGHKLEVVARVEKCLKFDI